MKNYLLGIFLLAIAFSSFQVVDTSFASHSEIVVDSAIKSDTAATVYPAASNTSVGPIVLPTWMLSIIAGISAALPLIQFVLKRIPTQDSVRIKGIGGKLLDILTFFQPDKSTAVHPLAPPAVLNGNEPPRLIDLLNHK